MSLPSIHVGCGDFSLQRLEVLVNGELFKPVACVDIDAEKARIKISKINKSKVKNLKDKIYSTISEAQKKNQAKACFIFVSSKEHFAKGPILPLLIPNLSIDIKLPRVVIISHNNDKCL